MAALEKLSPDSFAAPGSYTNKNPKLTEWVAGKMENLIDSAPTFSTADFQMIFDFAAARRDENYLIDR